MVARAVGFHRTDGAADEASAALREAYGGARVKAGKGVAHAEEVGRVLGAAGCVEPVRLAGLLHDVVEDTAWTVDDVAARFGPAVGGLVAAVSEDGGITNYRRRKRALRSQIALAGPDAIDIALADKVASLRYALESGKRVPKRKVAHYVATVAMADAAAHPDLGRDVADLLATLDARDHPPVPLAP
jgi:(p)ppGpp synthase/HD superfamily hydrolase